MISYSNTVNYQINIITRYFVTRSSSLGSTFYNKCNSGIGKRGVLTSIKYKLSSLPQQTTTRSKPYVKVYSFAYEFVYWWHVIYDILNMTDFFDCKMNIFSSSIDHHNIACTLLFYTNDVFSIRSKLFKNCTKTGLYFELFWQYI